MAEQNLPSGWSLQRVRDVAQAPDAEFGELKTPVVWEHSDDPVAVASILVFGNYVLVQQQGEQSWSMGALHEGHATLWADYGEDLEQALRSL